METLASILVVDDEVHSVESLKRILSEDFDVHTATDVQAARYIMAREWIQVILCDQRMPDMTGVEFLTQVREQWPDVVRIILSGYTDADDIIEAVNKAGIYQYLSKPLHPERLIHELKNAVKLFHLQRQNEQLSIELKFKPSTLKESLEAKYRALQAHFAYDKSIIRSPNSCMNKICDTIGTIAPYDINVLITGESGTGKELCARALHYNSLRKDGPFVAQNCAALPDELLESELFGHKRGAFTGAVEDRVGLFELADGGTIFLDEIGDTSAAFQVKLLRVLQEGEIRPLGNNRRRHINVRVIAATNCKLVEAVRSGDFRDDLYYRLATMTIEMPPLRQRPEDIIPLALHLLDQAMTTLAKRVKGFTAEALDCLQSYHWPGNVRELQNEIKRMLVLANEDYLSAELISAHVLHATPVEDESDMNFISGIEGTLKQRVETLEARILKETLIRNRWNKTRAAEELGLSRVGLRSKLERYGLQKVEHTPKLRYG